MGGFPNGKASKVVPLTSLCQLSDKCLCTNLVVTFFVVIVGFGQKYLSLINVDTQLRAFGGSSVHHQVVYSGFEDHSLVYKDVQLSLW